MFEALVQDRADFVQLFIDSGVNFKKFLTIRRLRDLYEKVKVHYILPYLWFFREEPVNESSDITKTALNLNLQVINLTYYDASTDLMKDLIDEVEVKTWI